MAQLKNKNKSSDDESLVDSEVNNLDRSRSNSRSRLNESQTKSRDENKVNNIIKKSNKSTLNSKIKDQNDLISKQNEQIKNIIDVNETNFKEIQTKYDLLYDAILAINNNLNISNNINNSNNKVELKRKQPSSSITNNVNNSTNDNNIVEIKKQKITMIKPNLEKKTNTNRFEVLAQIHADAESSFDGDVTMNAVDSGNADNGTADNGNADNEKNEILNNNDFPSLVRKIKRQVSNKRNFISSDTLSNSIKNINKNITTDHQSSNDHENLNNENNNVKLNKLPPIVAYQVDLKILRSEMAKLNSTDYTIINGANDNRVLLKSDNLKTYNDLKTTLASGKVNYFTYTPKNERGVNVILKFVPYDFEIEDIKAEFEYLGVLGNIENITRLNDFGKAKFNYFIIKLKPDVLPGPYFNIKKMFNTFVRIELFNRSSIVQCYNCQRPGHVAENCRMPSRCVKCSLNHPDGECSVTSDHGRKSLTCALCNLKGHPASYRGCSIIKKIVSDNKKNKKSENRVTNSAHSNLRPASQPLKESRLRENLTFAEATKSGSRPIGNVSGNNKNKTNKLMDILDQEAYVNFGCDFRTLDQKFVSFMESYGTCVDSLEKKILLLNFISETRYG